MDFWIIYHSLHRELLQHHVVHKKTTPIAGAVSDWPNKILFVFGHKSHSPHNNNSNKQSHRDRAIRTKNYGKSSETEASEKNRGQLITGDYELANEMEMATTA